MGERGDNILLVMLISERLLNVERFTELLAEKSAESAEKSAEYNGETLSVR